MNLDLKGKRAIVCGASKGIGRAAAAELALLGASVTLVARDAAALAEAAKSLAAAPGQAHLTLAADFIDYEDVGEKIARHLKEAGPAHILINNGGGPPPGPALAASADDYAAVFAQHLMVGQVLVQAVAPGMKEAKYGKIVNIISTSVKQPIRGLGVSNTIRAAVANWAKTLAGELAPFGITVNNVLPGATGTGRIREVLEARAKKAGRTLAQVTEEEIAQIPAGRFADASETGAAIAFLCSPAAAYINGINLPVDGGRTSCL